jgi:hypothetical protein
MTTALDPANVTTANDLPGYRITRCLGMVRGVTVRSRSVFGTIGASLQTLVGGNISLFTELCEKTREEAFELFSALRLEHQVTQIEQGREPDDMLDPEEIDPLTRRYLRDAFREVAAVQRTFAGRLDHR